MFGLDRFDSQNYAAALVLAGFSDRAKLVAATESQLIDAGLKPGHARRLHELATASSKGDAGHLLPPPPPLPTPDNDDQGRAGHTPALPQQGGIGVGLHLTSGGKWWAFSQSNRYMEIFTLHLVLVRVLYATSKIRIDRVVRVCRRNCFVRVCEIFVNIFEIFVYIFEIFVYDTFSFCFKLIPTWSSK